MRWILVDRLMECVPAKRAVAIKCFSRSDLVFMDHIHAKPIVPGVLLLEMAAKTAHLCYQAAYPDTAPVIGIVKHAKFYRFVEPGDQCWIEVTLMDVLPDCLVANGTIKVEGAIVGSVEFISPVLPAPDPGYVDPILLDWNRRSTSQR